MIPFLLPTLALIGVASPTVVKLLPPPRVNPNACPPVVRPPPSIPLVSSSSLSGLVAFSRANASQETFVFVSGNKAMNAMIQNWASSVYALAPRSFSFVAVPLDKEGAATLAASARVPLFYDEPALETFSPTEGLFGAVNYKAMARYKWELASRVLALDAPVLWSDPDIVLFRNPLPYLDGLPKCDIILQGEMAALGFWDDVLGADVMTPRRVLGLYSGSKEQQMFNTGFVRISPTEGSKKVVAHMLETFHGLNLTKTHYDDQEIFNSLIMHQYWLQGSEQWSPKKRNAFWRDEMVAGRCVRYQRRSTGDEFSMWVLNPVLFPLRPTHDDLAMRRLMLEPAYLTHYNWAIGAQYKVEHMRNDCAWFEGAV